MDSGFDKFLNAIGQVPVALGQVLLADASHVGVLVGGSVLVLGVGIAAAYGLQTLVNKARYNRSASHYGTPAE